MHTTSKRTNMAIRMDKSLKKSVDSLKTNTNSTINMFLRPCDKEQRLAFTTTITPETIDELLASLQEIEDYKNDKIELENYEDVKTLRRALIND